jgi:hypothetical protein
MPPFHFAENRHGFPPSGIFRLMYRLSAALSRSAALAFGSSPLRAARSGIEP